MAFLICPKTIVRASDQIIKDETNKTRLFPSDNTFNLEYIIWDVNEAVLLSLILCKKEKQLNQNICPFINTEHIYSEAEKFTCNYENDLAEIYFRHETYNPKARSGIVLFLDSALLNQTNDIVEIFKNSVEWLEIVNERPYLFIVYKPYPMLGLDIKRNMKLIDDSIRKVYNGYSKKEKICTVEYSGRDDEFLKIMSTPQFSVRTTTPK